jgi:DNA-directed RNA polymerase subunit RPC12/RpoP
VIRFKCIYCGQRILAKEDGVGKKGKCPKCKHELVVPETTKGRPAISSDKEPMPDRSVPRVPAWDENSGFKQQDAEEVLVELYKESFRFLIPTYDELSLFLMAVTLIALYLVNGQLRNQINMLVARIAEAGRLLLISVGLVAVCVFGLCIYHVFTTREKTTFEKWVMLIFAIGTNVVTGSIAAAYTITSALTADWLLVFPLWNIINGILLLFLVGLRAVDEECISDRKATASEVVIGLIAVFIVLIFCNYVFKLHWAITFSICIIYTTSFDRALQSVFPGLSHGEDEQDA